MIEINGLTAAYGSREVLHGISMTAETGTVTTVLGPNGSGKSTLLRALAGQLSYGGQILLDGTEVRSLPPTKLATRVAYLAQGRDVPDITAGRMVLHGRFPYLRYPRRYGPADLAAAREAMDQLGIGDLADCPMNTLSGGMRQKVYIAMALAQQTPVILMDEPTTYLDIGQQAKFAQTARDLARRGKTVVLVLHDLPLALRISDRLLVLEAGSARAQGTADALVSDGILDRIYGVRLGRLPSESGDQYYHIF